MNHLKKSLLFIGFLFALSTTPLVQTTLIEDIYANKPLEYIKKNVENEIKKSKAKGTLYLTKNKTNS